METISLTDDMVTEIILRLPVKSAAWSMCNAWHATISDDYVRRRLPPQMSLVYFPDDLARGARFASSAKAGLLEDCDLGFFPFLDGAVPCDASNGLLLFRSAARLYVVDPVAPTDATLSALAFDPSAPRYHVINITGWRGRVGELEVFSSATWEWAARDADFGVMAGSLSGTMHLHGGAVYFLAFEPDCIVRMDVAGACATIELPEPTDGDTAPSRTPAACCTTRPTTATGSTSGIAWLVMAKCIVLAQQQKLLHMLYKH